MIDLVEFLCNLSFSLACLLVRSLLVIRKPMSMVVTSSTSPTPPSPPLPWKRFADAPLLAPKRSKDSPRAHRPRHADEGMATELHPRAIPAPWRRELVTPSVTARRDVVSGHGQEPEAAVRDVSILCVHANDGEDMQRRKFPVVAGGTGGEDKVGCPRVRRRPMRIVIPETDMGCGFGEVGKVDSDGELQVEGSCYAMASRRGKRRVMEDGYDVITNINGDSKQAYFGVFDGHGGRAAVDFVSEKLGHNILAALVDQQDHQKGSGDPRTAIMEGYLTTDKEFISQGVASGVCAATVLLKDGEVHAANVGDCRVVMSKEGVATMLTADHRPQREDERARIDNSGGYVSCHNGVWRVQGSLAVSRAIGDLHMKDWVIPEPETTRLGITSDCDFLIMASDGLWDKVSNQEAVDVVAKQKDYLLQSCKKLVDMSCSRGSRDDITVLVVDLQRFVQGR